MIVLVLFLMCAIRSNGYVYIFLPAIVQYTHYLSVATFIQGCFSYHLFYEELSLAVEKLLCKALAKNL
jgi:hypothetical protein